MSSLCRNSKRVKAFFVLTNKPTTGALLPHPSHTQSHNAPHLCWSSTRYWYMLRTQLSVCNTPSPPKAGSLPPGDTPAPISCRAPKLDRTRLNGLGGALGWCILYLSKLDPGTSVDIQVRIPNPTHRHSSYHKYLETRDTAANSPGTPIAGNATPGPGLRSHPGHINTSWEMAELQPG